MQFGGINGSYFATRQLAQNTHSVAGGSTYSIPGINGPPRLLAAVLGSLDGRQAGARDAEHLDFRQRIRISPPRSGRTDPVELTVTMMA